MKSFTVDLEVISRVVAQPKEILECGMKCKDRKQS